MARFITFNGVTIFHPGGLTKIDATDLAQVSGGTSGVVGLIGEADSGEPNSALSPKVHEFTNPNSAVQMFKSGPLADAIDFVFRPSTDPRIPGGAQKILAIKTNQSTASSVILADQPTANNSMTATSRTFGAAAEQLSIEVNQTAAAADPFQNRMDVTIADASSGVTETFTSIAGTPLMNVQYRGPSAPTVRETGAGVSEHTIVLGFAAHDIRITADITTGVAVGNFIRLKTNGAGGSTTEFVAGQMRRVDLVDFNVTNPGVTTIHLDQGFTQPGGQAVTPAHLNTLTFECVREVAGPFRANSGTANTAVLNCSSDNVTGWAPGDPLFGLNNVHAGSYADITEGWCYLKIVAGSGAGQIRRIDTITGSAAAGVGASDLAVTLAVHDDWDTVPDGTSQIMLINTAARGVHSATDSDNDCGAQARIQGGSIAATLGTADKLFLEVMPGAGEDNGAGVVILPTAAGIAGAGYVEYYEFDLGGSISVSTLVNRIQLGINAFATNGEVAAGHIDPTKTAWNARVGLGRSGDLTTDRFDFMLAGGTRFDTDVTNGTNTVGAPIPTSPSVDALVDFSQVFNNTWNSAGDSLKRHRLLDNLSILIDTINAQSLLVSGVRDASGTPAVDSNGDGVPVFGVVNNLAGAAIGVSTFQTISNAFDQLIKHRHDTAVALFSGPVPSPPGGPIPIASIHALLEQHTINGAGAFKNEVDAIGAFDPPTAATALDDVITQANAVANRNMAMVYQQPTRINAQGVKTVFGSHMLAAAIAGMQAGSPVGTPLTFKFVRALDITSPPTADPLDVDDVNQMLQNGVLFAEKVTNGFRIVRNLSTFIQTDNLAFTDRNVNYELNYIAYDLRTFIENTFIGTKAIPATAVNMKDAVISKLIIYRDDLEIITRSNDPVTGQEIDAFRDLKVTISGDIATIRFEIFPTLGINFMTFEIFAQLPVISA